MSRMAICPFAAWRPVVNYTATTIQHLGVVIHVTASENDPWGWFDNPAAQASSHFFIGNGQGGVPDGELEQFVDTTFKAWAEAAGNTSYVSVETEGEPTEPLTAAQIATFGRLYAWLNAVHGVPFVITDTPGASGFITHGDGGVAWGDHPGCPGPLRSPQRADILAAAHQPTPAPNPTPVPNGENMAVTPPVSFKSGQEDIFQVSGGALYHKWNGGMGWGNEALAGPNGGTAAGTSGAKFTVAGSPQVRVDPGSLCQVVVEDSSGFTWLFAQTATSGSWGVNKLP